MENVTSSSLSSAKLGGGGGFVKIDLMPVNSRWLLLNAEDAVGAAAMALNLVLTVVLLCESSETLKAYTRVLMQNCICNMCYSLATITSKLSFDIYNGQLMMLIDGVYRHLPHCWHIVGLSIYVFCLYMVMFVIPIVFYFRYKIVVHNLYLSATHLMSIIAFLAAYVGVMVGTLIAAVLNYGGDRERTCLEVFAGNPMWTYNGVLPVHNCLITYADDVYTLAYYALCGVANVAMYAVMIFCTRAVFAALRKARPNMRSKTVKRHRQMNMLLLVQLVTPTVLTSLPLTAAIVDCVLRLNFAGLSLLIMASFICIPLINPCITIVLVSNYRRKFLRLAALPWRIVVALLTKDHKIGSVRDYIDSTTRTPGPNVTQNSRRWSEPTVETGRRSKPTESIDFNRPIYPFHF